MPLYRASTGTGGGFTAAGNLALGGAAATSYGLEILGGDVKLDALATPSNVVTTVNSGSGTTYYYYVIAEDRNGYRTLPNATGTSANTSAAAPNVTVTWNAVPGAAKYYLLRHTATPLPLSVGAYLAGTWTSGPLSLTDTTVAPLPNFTPTSRNTTGDLYVDGNISCAGNSTGTGNEVFGSGAFITTGTITQNTLVGGLSRAVGVAGSGVAVGYAASTNGSTVSVGLSATSVGSSAVAVGPNSSALASGNMAFGGNTSVPATASNCIVIGNTATVTGTTNYSIAIGVNATVATSNTAVFGSSTQPISTFIIGQGAQHTSALAALLTTTSGTVGQSDKAGSDLSIAGGKGTGMGVGGTVKIQTAPAAGSTATSANALVDRFAVDQLGNVVLSAGGSALLTTATDGFTYIPTCAGVPSVAPTAKTGAAALVYNTTDNRLCIYNPTGTPAWKFITLGA